MSHKSEQFLTILSFLFFSCNSDKTGPNCVFARGRKSHNFRLKSYSCYYYITWRTKKRGVKFSSSFFSYNYEFISCSCLFTSCKKFLNLWETQSESVRCVSINWELMFCGRQEVMQVMEERNYIKGKCWHRLILGWTFPFIFYLLNVSLSISFAISPISLINLSRCALGILTRSCQSWDRHKLKCCSFAFVMMIQLCGKWSVDMSLPL